MILVSVQELTRQFDVDPVFQNVSFELRAGEKVGLVGPNGCGKSTLIRTIAGREEPDRGRVEVLSPSVRIGVLEQHRDLALDRSLLQEVRGGLQHLYDLQDESIRLAEQMASASPDQLERLHTRYDAVQHELERLDAYAIDHRVEEVLFGLGFVEEDFHRPLETFSGGQQNRAALGQLLLSAPDLMLLDEPTNHLDIESTEWLEDYLAKSPQAILLVSHDRYFLDRVTTRTLELFGGRMEDYSGNFSAYWQQREERHKVLRRTFEKQQEFIAKTEDFIRRNKYGQKHAQASDRVKKLERLERIELPTDFQELHMSFPSVDRTGDWVADAEHVTKGFGGPPLFEDLTMRVMRGDRLGILGPNGSGKTTLLKTLLGQLEPDAGKVRLGTNVKVGYFDQQLKSVDPNVDAVEAVRPADDPAFAPGQARQLLAKFGIRGELGLQRVGLMSGGERTKVALARLAAMKANVLVLDEPTNHLDFWACESLEQALKTFEGTILFVSHDRYFIDQVATRVVVFEPDRWRLHEGNYSDYQAFLRNMKSELAAQTQAKAAPAKPSEPAAKKNAAPAPKRQRKFPYRKVTDIESDIAAVEEEIGALEADLANPDVHRDAERIKAVQVEYAHAQRRLEELMAHWEEAVELN